METNKILNVAPSSRPVYDSRWYVVKTKPHAERQAAKVLEARDLVIYLPLLKRGRSFRGRSEALFPGYLFLNIDLNTNEYMRSRSAPGVSYILTVEGVPVPVMDSLVEEIRRRVDRENGLSPAARFASGDRVLVTVGPFQGIEAVFDRSLSPQGRSLILLQILGQLTRVQVDAEHLMKAGA